jgi:hypothetical protein
VSLFSWTRNHFRTCLLLLCTASCPACSRDAAEPFASRQGDDPAQPPLEINFKQLCGPPEGRQHVYDPETGVFHVHFKKPQPIGRFSGFYERSAFEVTKVAERFAKPVVFRLTGVPASYGCLGDPLTLSPGGATDNRRPAGDRYALVEDALAPGPVDEALFRVERTADVVTVTFTEKGRALLKPGAMISFKPDCAW